VVLDGVLRDHELFADLLHVSVADDAVEDVALASGEVDEN
jgi:hypothetical protein